MDQLGIVLDWSITSKYKPLFEVVYSIELLLIFAGIGLSFPLIWIIWSSEPLHRNLRIIFVVCIIQSAVLFITRPALIFEQYYGSKDAVFLLPFAVARIQSFVFYSVIMTGIALERLVATLFWEWYEKQRSSTLFVVAVVFGLIFTFVVWNTLSIAGLYRTENVFAMKTVASPLAGLIALTSCMIYVVLLAFNKYELRRMHKGKVGAYSLACTYQLRENVMIIRIMGPAFVISTPALAFRGLYLFLPHTPEFELIRSLAAAMFDLWISLVSAIMSFIFPLFNVRFRKPAKRFFAYRQIMRFFKSKKRRIQLSAPKEEADAYFESFNRAMSSPRPPHVTSISHHIKMHI